MGHVTNLQIMLDLLFDIDELWAGLFDRLRKWDISLGTIVVKLAGLNTPGLVVIR